MRSLLLQLFFALAIARTNSDYDPPEGYKPAKYGKEAQSDFDLDSILQDDDVELWLVRVPTAVRTPFF